MKSPISLAPRDGTVILTELGFVKYMTYICRTPGWVSCDAQGNEFECADNGYFYEEPSSFGPLPDWLI